MNAQKIISVLPSQHSEKPYAQRQKSFGLVTSSDERRKPINAGLSPLFVWQKGFRPVFSSVLVVPASGYLIFSSVIPVAPQLWCNCPTAVVQLPHNCGATAPQLWGNKNIPCKNKKKGQKNKSDGETERLSPLRFTFFQRLIAENIAGSSCQGSTKNLYGTMAFTN